MSFFTSLWSFLSVVVIAWITQRIMAHWERRKSIDETRLKIFMGWMPYLAEWYSQATHNIGSIDPQEFVKKKIEILGTLQIMGPDSGIDAFIDFCDMAEKSFRKDPSFDGQKLHERFTRLNYILCCEIHGEKEKKRSADSRL
jgi:hypothetical protein